MRPFPNLSAAVPIALLRALDRLLLRPPVKEVELSFAVQPVLTEEGCMTPLQTRNGLLPMLTHQLLLPPASTRMGNAGSSHDSLFFTAREFYKSTTELFQTWLPHHRRALDVQEALHYATRGARAYHSGDEGLPRVSFPTSSESEQEGPRRSVPAPLFSCTEVSPFDDELSMAAAWLLRWADGLSSRSDCVWDGPSLLPRSGGVGGAASPATKEDDPERQFVWDWFLQPIDQFHVVCATFLQQYANNESLCFRGSMDAAANSNKDDGGSDDENEVWFLRRRLLAFLCAWLRMQRTLLMYHDVARRDGLLAKTRTTVEKVPPSAASSGQRSPQLRFMEDEAMGTMEQEMESFEARAALWTLWIGCVTCRLVDAERASLLDLANNNNTQGSSAVLWEECAVVEEKTIESVATILGEFLPSQRGLLFDLESQLLSPRRRETAHGSDAATGNGSSNTSSLSRAWDALLPALYSRVSENVIHHQHHQQQQQQQQPNASSSETASLLFDPMLKTLDETLRPFLMRLTNQKETARNSAPIDRRQHTGGGEGGTRSSRGREISWLRGKDPLAQNAAELYRIHEHLSRIGAGSSRK